MRTWSFVAQKGGVGKSTLACHLAVYAEAKGEVVAILDIDQQTTALRWAKERGGNEPMVFAAATGKLRDSVEAARTLGVSLVLIDAPSKIEAPALAAIACSDLIIVPTRPGLLNLDALDATAKIIEDSGKLQSAIAVVNAVESNKVETSLGEAEAALHRLKLAMCPVYVCQRAPLETSLNSGRGITESHPKNPGAEEIRKLWGYLDKLTTARKAKVRA
jgi:chromosome partitioning protein